ncbi:MAG: hypothetical protein ACOYT4_02850 [Nanoarchaeota archaeon]
MSLEDKFYPDDGSCINKFDNFMIKAAGCVGETYQSVTGDDYKGLVKISFDLASKLSLISIVGNPVSILSYYLIKSYKENPDFNTPLQEEIKLEAYGKNKKKHKYARCITLAVSGGLIILGYSLHSLNSSLYAQEEIYNIFKITNLAIIMEGMSLGIFDFAQYLSKANMPKPPKGSIWDRTKKKLKDYFGPKPVLKPIPIPVEY